MGSERVGGERGKEEGEEKGKDEEKGASGWVGASHIKSSVRDFLLDGRDRCLF